MTLVSEDPLVLDLLIRVRCWCGGCGVGGALGAGPAVPGAVLGPAGCCGGAGLEAVDAIVLVRCGSRRSATLMVLDPSVVEVRAVDEVQARTLVMLDPVRLLIR